MRRTTMFLFALAVTYLVPTVAHAASPSLDPNGQSLTVLQTWVDSLGSVLLTYLGV